MYQAILCRFTSNWKALNLSLVGQIIMNSKLNPYGGTLDLALAKSLPLLPGNSFNFNVSWRYLIKYIFSTCKMLFC